MLALVVVLAVLDATWLYLALLRGFFWTTSVRLAPERSLDRWPSVAVVVPARDEEEVLRLTLPRLLAMDYPGEAKVVLVDDRSGDGTGFLARALAADPSARLPLTIVAGTEPAPRWMGKVWAMEQGRLAAGAVDYVLLTDADIDHPPRSLRRLVAQAETDGLDVVSLMAKLRAVTGWERLVVPAFVYFFAQLYPFSWVNRRSSRTAAAAGGCILVRRAALEGAGAFESVRGAVIDDVSLGRALKSSGSTLWLGFADDVASIRPYDRLADLWRMVARSAFTQLRYSPALLAGTVVGLLFTFLLPVGAVVGGALAGDLLVLLLGAAAWLLMALTYVPMLRYYGVTPLASVLLPFAASLYAAMTVDSARRHWFGSGVAWKGRSYAVSR
ncbi:MAG TPA: glycosyl transferase family 2 [Acidimicrobiaceae bacterium]|nr:glycosyl transferase family 2 [Acidimicrobiaceae bacterium]